MDKPSLSDAPMTPDLINSVLGPHEWGYRDPVVGGFISDEAPFRLAEAALALSSPAPELEQAIQSSASRPANEAEMATVALETCIIRLGTRIDAAAPVHGSVAFGVGFAVEIVAAMNRALALLSDGLLPGQDGGQPSPLDTPKDSPPPPHTGGWLAIETCPTGRGAEVMAIWFDSREPDTYDGPERIQMDEDRQGFWNLNSGNRSKRDTRSNWPTHWRPLPPPPTQEST